MVNFLARAIARLLAQTSTCPRCGSVSAWDDERRAYVCGQCGFSTRS